MFIFDYPLFLPNVSTIVCCNVELNLTYLNKWYFFILKGDFCTQSYVILIYGLLKWKKNFKM